jgi:hypothetical protein
VIRPDRDQNKISLLADLEKIKDGEMPDIRLQGGDIVQVSSSTAKLVPYGIYEFFVTAQVDSRQDSQDQQDFHGAVGTGMTCAAGNR